MPSIKEIIAGVAGIVEWKVGRNLAREEDMQKRMAACVECNLREGKPAPDVLAELNQKKIFSLGKCSKCGCFLVPKISLVGQTCPDGRW